MCDSTLRPITDINNIVGQWRLYFDIFIMLMALKIVWPLNNYLYPGLVKSNLLVTSTLNFDDFINSFGTIKSR